MNIIIDMGIDSLIDCIKLFPFLFLTYLAMEWLEHKAGDKTVAIVGRAGKAGPIAGGILGIFPQCGFSAAASGLYAGRLITVGTLLAVYLSTSDEMLPIMLSHGTDWQIIGKILLVKMVIAVITGLVIDFLLRYVFVREAKQADIHHMCEHEQCHCDENHVLQSAFHHTIHIFLFLFLITFVLNVMIGTIGEENLSDLIVNTPVVGQLLAALVGLIPNCASSVVITDLYLSGVLNGGAMMSGLLVGAGVGLLVLFRSHDNFKKNLQILGMLYCIGVFWGILIQLSGIL